MNRTRSDIEFRRGMKDDLVLRNCYTCYRNLLDYLKEKTFYTDTFPHINMVGCGITVPLEGISLNFAKEIILPWVHNWNNTQRGLENRGVSLPHLIINVPGNLISVHVPLSVRELMTIQSYYE